ncbi:MAG: DUF2341 domain-containing protein [Acidobacteriia bacterium]|nr:DUF2341 domain-containing protein [Terriglobia bacterium]
MKIANWKLKIKTNVKIFLISLFYLVRHPRRFYNALSSRGKKWALRGLITLLIILIAVPVSLWYSAKNAKAAWWNENWMYRKRIDITNGSGSNLTDFQVSFTIDTTDTTKFQATCADIRVTDNTGKLIPYWIEENNPGCGNASTKIWTKVPSLPSSGGTIYVYYGNQSATAAQSGEKTFDFFDDFDADSINSAKWDEVIEGTGGTVSTSGGAAVLSPNANTISSANLRSVATFTNNVVFEMRRKQATNERYLDFSLGSGSVVDTDNGGSTDWWHTSTLSGYVWYYNAPGNAANGIYRMPVAGGKVGVNTSSFTTDTSTYKIHKMSYSSAGAISWSIDGVSEASGTDNTFLSDAKKIMISEGEYSNGLGDDQSVDWIYAHKYASTAPTTSLASEEKGPGPLAYWKLDEGHGDLETAI